MLPFATSEAIGTPPHRRGRCTDFEKLGYVLRSTSQTRTMRHHRIRPPTGGGYPCAGGDDSRSSSSLAAFHETPPVPDRRGTPACAGTMHAAPVGTDRRDTPACAGTMRHRQASISADRGHSRPCGDDRGGAPPAQGARGVPPSVQGRSQKVHELFENGGYPRPHGDDLRQVQVRLGASWEHLHGTRRRFKERCPSRHHGGSTPADENDDARKACMHSLSGTPPHGQGRRLVSDEEPPSPRSTPLRARTPRPPPPQRRWERG